MRRSILTLVVLASATFFLGLGRQAITDMDEAYYAEAAREMVETGDWLTPHFNYEDRWEKPVLYYWLTASLYEVTGPREISARFWSALAGAGLVLLTFGVARDAGASDAASWLAGAIAATCFGYFAEARLALPDLPLAFCITLAVWMTLRQRWALAGAMTGLGFLMKGPVALVVPAVVLLPIWWRERASLRISWRGAAVAAALFVVIGVPWYVAMALVHGRAYLASFFVGDNLERFTTGRFGGRLGAWWYYVPMLLGGLVPWTIYAVTLLIDWASAVVRRRRLRLTDWQWRLLIWAVMPLLFFSASIGKQPRYILPVLPPLAALLAVSMSRRTTADGVPQRAMTAATLITAALFVVIGLLLRRAQPVFITAYAPLTTFGVALMFAWGAALAGLAAVRSWTRLPVMMSVAAASLLLVLQFGALAGVRPEPVERVAQMLRAYRVGNDRVGECRVFERNLVFYAGYRQEKDLCSADLSPAAAFLASADRVFLVARERDVAALRARGVAARELGRVEYVDTGNIKLRTLLWPAAEQVIETILVVTNQ